VDIEPTEHFWLHDYHASTAILKVPIRFRIANTIGDEFDHAGVAAVRHEITLMNFLARVVRQSVILFPLDG
jgi:hypothetical protein